MCIITRPVANIAYRHFIIKKHNKNIALNLGYLSCETIGADSGCKIDSCLNYLYSGVIYTSSFDRVFYGGA